MTGDKEWERCAPDDQRRCQATNGMHRGQCPYKAQEGHKFCGRHMAGSEKQAMKAQANSLRLGAYFATRTNELAGSSELKNLRGEVGIIRKMIEEITDNISNFNEMMAHSSRLRELIRDSMDLVRAVHQMDEKLGLMMDKDKVISIATGIVDIIGEHIKDPVILDDISEKIGKLFAS